MKPAIYRKTGAFSLTFGCSALSMVAEGDGAVALEADKLVD